MKICVLTHTFPRNKKDSVAAFMKEFCDGLVQAGAETIVVTPYDTKFDRSPDCFDVITYKYIWPDRLHLLGYSRMMNKGVLLRSRAYLLLPLMLIFGTAALYKAVRKEKVDLINVHWILPNGLMAMIVSRLTKIPYVITLPGTDVYLACRYKIFGWVARLIAQKSSGIVSNSSRHLNKILKNGVSGKKTAVYPYPVDTSFFKPINYGLAKYRQLHGLNKNNLVILAVGRLVYKKGYEYLIKAIPKIAKKYPEVKLLICGAGGLDDELAKLSAKLKIIDNIVFVGNIPRDEVIYYYNLADVMVAPSVIAKGGNLDGGPVSTFESMACGKAQIVTDILGAADVIENNINGFKVPQKSTSAIENALDKLLSSKTLRDKMGKENRRLIVDRFSTEKVGESYLTFFRGVMPLKQC